ACRTAPVFESEFEARVARRIEGREGRAPVLRDVDVAAGREVRARPEVRELRRHGGERLLHARRLRDVALLDAEQGDVRRLLARAEDLQRALVGLVRRYP